MLDGGERHHAGTTTCIAQYPLGPALKEDGYTHTRCFIISAETSAAGRLKDLTISIEPIPEKTPGTGTPKTDLPWRKVAERLFEPQADGDGAGLMFREVRKTSLDFSVAKPSRVVILLVGDFWRFSETLDPLTTKQELKAQYFGLLRHRRTKDGQIVDITKDMECRCISFSTAAPVEGARHGFSLNVDLLIEVDKKDDGREILPLPITIDPDIENKGGNG